MAKETKNVITRESCQKDLERRMKGELRFDFTVLAILLLICGPLIGIAIYLTASWLVFGVATAALCAVGPCIGIFMVVRTAWRLHLLAKGEFSVVKDTVCRTVEGEIPKFGEGRQYVNAVYFAEYGRTVRAPFSLCSVGDECYLAVLHTKKKEIVLVYHTVTCDYKETAAAR